MMIYLIATIFIIVYAIIGNVNKNKFRKKVFLIISFGILTIIAMLRKYTVGIDLEIIYTPTFEEIKNISFANLSKVSIEIGYAFINKVLSLFTDDIQILIVFSSICTFPIYGWFIYKNSKDVVLSTLLFLITSTYFMSMNVVRQALAISLILIAYETIKKNKTLKSIVLILIATSIHASAIICLSFILFKRLKWKKSYLRNSLIILIIALIFMNPIISIYSSVTESVGLSNNKNYDYYLESDRFGVGYINLSSLSDVVLYAFVFLLGCYLLAIYENEDNNYDFLMYMSYLAILFTILSLKMSVISRLALYFIPFVLLMIPEELLKMKNRKNRQFICVILVGFLFAKYVYILNFLAGELFGVVPYLFFWQ